MTEIYKGSYDYFEGILPESEKGKYKYIPTISALLENCEEKFADKPALGNDNGTVTYKEMCDNIAKRRGLLSASGLKFGDRVAVFSPNTTDAIEAYLAVMSAGCVVIMLPAALPVQAVAGICAKFRVSALIANFDDEQKKLIPVQVLPLKNGYGEPAPAANLDPRDAAAIYFTGGTTGAPRGACLTHGALTRGGYNGIFTPSVSENDVYVTMLPLSHVFGSVRGLLTALYTGALVYECPDMKAGIGKIPMIRPTILVLVPGLAEILLGIAKMRGAGFLGGRLQTIISGAAPVPPRLVRLFEEFKVNLLPGYGLTETANLVSGNGDIAGRPDSVGRIYGEQELRLVDGEIQIKGDCVTTGYFGDPEATAAAFDGEWFRTGDLGRVDEDGFLYITGRIKNLIILPNGENVSPEEIEEVFYKNPLVRDCVAFADESTGRPVIAIEIQPEAAAVAGADDERVRELLEGVVADANEKLPEYKRVAKLLVRREDFERSPAMKILRKH